MPFGKKYEFKVNKVPHALTYDPMKVMDTMLRKKPQSALITEDLNLYKRPKSARPEPNTNWIKPCGASVRPKKYPFGGTKPPDVESKTKAPFNLFDSANAPKAKKRPKTAGKATLPKGAAK